MSYLNPQYANNFQELCAAMPLFYLDVLEMRAVLRAQGALLDGNCDGLELIIANNFIQTADETTIKQWEAALDITYEEKLTLDQRRSVVIARITGNGHIGEPEIREIIGHYTERAVTVAFAKGVIYITIEGEIFGEGNLVDTLLRRIPAHLALKITLDVRRSFRQDIPFPFGGATGSRFWSAPETMDRISSRRNVTLAHGAMTAGFTKGEPVTADRISSNLPLSVAQAGFGYITATGNTTDVKKAATGRAEAAGGLFCYTHTKSKLIG